MARRSSHWWPGRVPTRRSWLGPGHGGASYQPGLTHPHRRPLCDHDYSRGQAAAWFTTGVTVVASGLVPDGYHVGDEPRRYILTLSPYLPALVNHAQPPLWHALCGHKPCC